MPTPRNGKLLLLVATLALCVGCLSDPASVAPANQNNETEEDAGDLDVNDGLDPDADEPDTGDPDADEPDASEPDAGEPDADEPVEPDPDLADCQSLATFDFGISPAEMSLSSATIKYSSDKSQGFVEAIITDSGNLNPDYLLRVYDRSDEKCVLVSDTGCQEENGTQFLTVCGGELDPGEYCVLLFDRAINTIPGAPLPALAYEELSVGDTGSTNSCSDLTCNSGAGNDYGSGDSLCRCDGCEDSGGGFVPGG